MQAKRKEISAVTAEALNLDPATVGAAGSGVEVVSVAFPDTGGGAQMIEGDAETAAAALVQKLASEARVLG